MLKWKGEELKKKTDRVIPWAMNSIMADCVKDAKSNAPVSTAAYQGSIRMEMARKITGIWTGVWGSFNCAYAIFIEKGSGPHHTANKSEEFVFAITEWCKRHGIEDAYPVIRAIRRRGTKAHPVLVPAADRNYKNLRRKIREGMRTA